MTQATRGGVVFSSNLAVRLAEVLCSAHYGEQELERQKPLTAADKGSYWHVEGNWNRDRKVDGPGAFFVSFEKYDGRITDFGQLFAYHADPSFIPAVKQYLKRKKMRSNSVRALSLPRRARLTPPVTSL